MFRCKALKIGIVHNKYKISGGEDAVVGDERLMLLERGECVLDRFVDNEIIHSFFSKLITALSCPYSFQGRSDVDLWLKESMPDLVHVHNFFPFFSPSIFDAMYNRKVPSVFTLHNYRTICPTSLLMFKGVPDERSICNSAFWAVPHRVYRNSYFGTFVLSCMIELHKRIGTWSKKVDRFICLTDFSKRKFVEAGFPYEKIKVKPNFFDDPGGIDVKSIRKGGLYVGRLSTEKGVSVLLSAWDKVNYYLSVIGEGGVDALMPDCIDFLGPKKQEYVIAALKKAEFLIVPSICYEGFPRVIVEAFACGTPVICSRLGSMEEIVEHGVTGLHFESGNPDSLAEAVNWMMENPKRAREMGENARLEYEAKYTKEKNYAQLKAIYNEAIEEVRNR